MAPDGKSGGDTPGNETFLGRWSRRKRVEPAQREVEDAKVAVAEARAAEVQALANASAAPITATPGESNDAPADSPADLPAIESLTPESDYTRFMQPDVPRASRNAAMKKLFTDPHFNVMDGLDTYIADYNIEDPIPESMLRELAQSKMLGLFDKKKEEEPVTNDSAAADAGVSAAVRDDGAAVPIATVPIAAEANASTLVNPDVSIQSAAVQP